MPLSRQTIVLGNPEDLAAAEALMQLSEAFDISPPPRTNNHGVDHVVPISQDNQHVQRSPPPSQQTPVSSTTNHSSLSPNETFLHDLLQQPPLREFVRLALRTSSLDVEAERRIMSVLEVMKSRNCAEEAMWYLDENDWDIQKATTQYQADEARRIQHQSPLYALVNQHANPITRQNFHASLLVFEYPEDAEHKTTTTRTSARFPHTSLFDSNQSHHIQALNQWRSGLSRADQELPPVPEFPRTGYTNCEERFLRNRFADLLDEFREGKSPVAKDIVRDFNAVFQGRYVPGALDPCGPRRLGSISNFIDRNWKRDEKGRRAPYLANYRAALRIKGTREREQKEYDALMGLGGVGTRAQRAGGENSAVGEAVGGGAEVVLPSVRRDRDLGRRG